MNVNVNLLPRKKGFFKKIIILTLFTLLCFFIKENVFASDLNGNNSNSSMPPFLEEYYTYSSGSYKFTCDDETQGFCNIYTYLEQFFSEFHSLYKNVVYVSSYNHSIENIHYIYFFFDTPKMTADKLPSCSLNNCDDITISFTADGVRNDYYSIVINEYRKTVNIKQNYLITDGDATSIYPGTYSGSLKTNFDLYSTNDVIIKYSDVKNWTYYELPAGAGISFKPYSNTKLTSAFSYNKENLYLTYYNFIDKEHEGYLKLDKPVTGTISYDFTLTNDQLSKYYVTLYNKGTKTAKIGYIAEDFELIEYADLFSPGVDSSGNSYDNPLGGLDEEINNDVVFDTNASILDNIVNFFSNFGNFLGDLANKIVGGLGDMIKYLFVPGEELEGFFREEYDYIKEQLGFLTYPIEIIVEFANRFYELDNNSSAVFKIPKLEIFNHTLYEGTEFDLMSIVNENDSIKYLYNIYKVVVSGFIVLWLTQLAIKKEHEIFGGGAS